MHMVLVMNLTSFAWSCYDGQLRTEAECDKEQRYERITKMPSFLEFFGFCFYFPGVLVGPSTRFHEYQLWASGKLYGPRMVPPPGRIVESLREMFTAVLALVLMIWGSGTYSYMRLTDYSDAVHTWPLWKRWVFIQVCGLVARFQYYGVWSLSNAGCILSGLAYNGIDPVTNKTKWTRCKNVYVAKLEFAHNWKELLDAWNSNTNIWLRECVYKRLAGNSKPKFGSFMGTFLASAAWHGIAPGYYIAFVTAALCQWVARSLRKYVRPIFYADPRRPDPTWFTMGQYTLAQNVYATLSNFVTITSVNYAVISFFTLSLRNSLGAYRAVYWHYHILVLFGIAAFRLGLGKPLRAWHVAPTPPMKKAQ